jgi:hypothetical protein
MNLLSFTARNSDITEKCTHKKNKTTVLKKLHCQIMVNYDMYHIMISHRRYLAGQKETVHYGFLDQVR